MTDPLRLNINRGCGCVFCDIDLAPVRIGNEVVHQMPDGATMPCHALMHEDAVAIARRIMKSAEAVNPGDLAKVTATVFAGMLVGQQTRAGLAEIAYILRRQA